MAMSNTFPHWKLFGHELNSNNAAVLTAVPRFLRLYTGSLAQIDGDYGFASMIHSLEHFVDPLATLKILRSKILCGGHLFVEVCNVEENPFDLLVADHLTHFSPGTLENIARRSGFTVHEIRTDWIKKELSMLAVADQLSTTTKIDVCCTETQRTIERIAENVSWLRALIKHAEYTLTRANGFGLFGTSIAATWLASVLGNKVSFFVDEDPNRIGKEHLGRPVFSPVMVPAGATVFMPLAPALSKAISNRLAHLMPNLVLPHQTHP